MSACMGCRFDSADYPTTNFFDKCLNCRRAYKVNTVQYKTLPDLYEKMEVKMEANEYQRLAARTINKNLVDYEKEAHALHGMVGEIGEIHSLYQKRYQGHDFDEEHMKKELGDLLWFIAEYCTVKGWDLGSVMQMNIGKLRARYPEGFDADHSLHRAAGDV